MFTFYVLNMYLRQYLTVQIIVPLRNVMFQLNRIENENICMIYIFNVHTSIIYSHNTVQYAYNTCTSYNTMYK